VLSLSDDEPLALQETAAVMMIAAMANSLAALRETRDVLPPPPLYYRARSNVVIFHFGSFFASFA
jgi:hypothetical protein